jgi:hypothetical protein
MNTHLADRRRFLACGGATALLAGFSPSTLLAASEPMSLAAFRDQLWSTFHFYDESGANQAYMFLMSATDRSIQASVEQFNLEFSTWGRSQMPNGVYYATSFSTGETLILNTVAKTPDPKAVWQMYDVTFGLLQE